MKSLSILLILASVLMVLVFKLAFTDAAALIHDDSIIESSASDEDDASLRHKKDTGLSAAQQLVPSPIRRHHLKFGVLGKRYTYGYLGKRSDVSQTKNNFEDWLDDIRERRAGRPQYGILG
ncbi:unnamed protein product [Adineta steineri]|uniref:Uncharacterized protein n=1 Tax=Adineta steineri TaxID=433720 RepID=A0A815EW59_9BILA|nr:unnamed protein product [Adineta steineri]CAF3691211.1 unnamed protein product [Adineta steineri]